MERLFEKLRVVPREDDGPPRGRVRHGKELVANALHHNSPRRARAFVALNCGAIPREIIESELFGHERGAFTGALVKRMGRIEQAGGGTLFLDEVSEMRRIAGEVSCASSRRSASRRWWQRVERSRLPAHRGDEPRSRQGDRGRTLPPGPFYRLSVVTLEIPPLRERKDDIPLLVERFRALFAEEHGKSVAGATPAALAALVAYEWPGNVRELKNVLESAVLFAAGPRIDVADLPPAIRAHAPGRPRSGEWPP